VPAPESSYCAKKPAEFAQNLLLTTKVPDGAREKDARGAETGAAGFQGGKANLEHRRRRTVVRAQWCAQNPHVRSGPANFSGIFDKEGAAQRVALLTRKANTRLFISPETKKVLHF
jgi:hypothetical protein